MSASEVVEASARTGRRFYGWRLALVGAFIVAVAGDGFGLPKIVDAVFSGSLLGDPGTAGFSAVHVALAFVLPALLLPFAGWAVDRWGARRMVVWRFAALGVGFALLVWSEIAAVYYVSVIVLTVGGAAASQLPMATAVNHWFRRRRATAMGVMLSPSLSAFLFKPLLAVGSGSAAIIHAVAPFLFLAAAMLALVWPMSRLVRDRPEDYGQLPDGRDGPVADGSGADGSDSADAVSGHGWREALGTREFWLITLGVGLTSSASGGTVIMALFLIERGIPPSDVAWVRMVQASAAPVASVLGGVVGDRVPMRRALLACSIMQVAAAGVLSFAATIPMILLFGVLAGTASGALLTLALAARGAYFGRRNFATITGVSMTPIFIMKVVGAVALGLLLDHQQPLLTVPVAAMTLGLVGSLFFLLLRDPRPPPSQSRQTELSHPLG